MPAPSDAVRAAVCRLESPIAKGYGFVIGNHQLLTSSAHISSKTHANAASAVFGSSSVPLKPDELYAASIELEYTVVDCDAVKFNMLKGVSPLRLKAAVVSKGDKLFILQGGNLAGVVEVEVLERTDRCVKYRGELTPGCTGMPVFNSNWDVVVVHKANGAGDEHEGSLVSSMLSSLNADRGVADDVPAAEPAAGVDGGATSANVVMATPPRPLEESKLSSLRREVGDFSKELSPSMAPNDQNKLSNFSTQLEDLEAEQSANEQQLSLMSDAFEAQERTKKKYQGAISTTVNCMLGDEHLNDEVFATCLPLLQDAKLSNITDTHAQYLASKHLNALQNLRGLSVSQSDISDDGISQLCQLTKLTSLDLSGTAASDLSSLAKLQSLTELDLSGAPVDSLSSLSALTNLRELNISNTLVTDVSCLRGLSNLVRVIAKDTQVASTLKQQLPDLLDDDDVDDDAPSADDLELMQYAVKSTPAGSSNADVSIPVPAPGDALQRAPQCKGKPCTPPSTMVHQFTGHTKGVSAIRFFPKQGHLLLSSGLDTKVKIWKTYGDYECLATLCGHEGTVKDVGFNADGSKFASCGYDQKVLIWDTATGKSFGTMTDGSSQSCLAFAPSSPSSLLVGSANNIVSEYDTRTGGSAAVRKYAGHSALVNCITFLGNSNQFVTSSDDKSIIAWELGNTTAVKKSDDFHMSLAAHPNGDHFIGQASHPADTIVGYSASQGYKQVMQKTFTGHNSRGGHAIQLGFSHDGSLLASGDGNGKVHVWDWLTTELKTTIDAHPGCPCIGVQWHPFETSMLATCSWDGTVRLFNNEEA